uniref:PH domain-containing protein n=1 Tax=Petromyzon marinus TaxID=7757 RepID=S4R9F4_PETMA
GYDKCQFDEVCWMIAAKKNFLRNRADAAIISHNDAFKLWRIFNFLSEDTYPLVMVPEEVEFLLRKLVAAMGGDWQSAETPELRMLLGGSKRSSSAEERGGGGGGVSVWELLSFLDAQPLTPGLEPRAVSFAIDDVHEEFLLDVMKKGSLSKKGHRRKNWTERWFVLRPGTMSYYMSEHQKEKKGDIVLERPCSVSSIVDKDGRKCLFMIKGLEKSFEISASDPRQKQEWITGTEPLASRPSAYPPTYSMPPPLPPCITAQRQRRREERGRRREEQAELARRMTEVQAARDTQNRELQQLAQAHREAEARAALEEQLRLQSQVELQKHYEFELLKEKQVRRKMEAEMAVRALEAEMQQRRIHELEEMHTQLRVALE